VLGAVVHGEQWHLPERTPAAYAYPASPRNGESGEHLAA
jgi:hypothetical protein